MVSSQRSRSLTRRRSRSAALAVRTFGALLVPLCLAGAVAGTGSAAGAATLPKVPAGVTLRFADQLESIQDLLTWSGQDSNLPYTLQFSDFVGGPPMLQAFEAGSVDAGFVADTPIIFAQAAGQPLTTVALWGPEHGSDALVSAPGVQLSGWKSLKGKKVAFQEGTVEEAVLLDGLHSVGLSLSDVTPVNVPVTSVTPALESGSVDAGILVQPLTAAYLQGNPTARQVVVGNDITARFESVIASRSALANPGKRAALADFVNRLGKAVQWVNAHPVQYVTDEYVDKYHVSLVEGEKLLAASGPSSFYPLPSSVIPAQQQLADLYHQVGVIPKRLNVASEFDGTFNSVVAPYVLGRKS